MRSSVPRLLLVSLVSAAMTASVAAAAEAGADGYIIKPVQRKTMLEKVAQWIGYPGGEAKKKKQQPPPP